MATSAPMDVLRDLAEKKLNDTALRLGRARQSHENEISRLQQLQTYESEYRRQLQDTITDKGMSISALQSWQGFIGELEKVVLQQKKQVSNSKQIVDASLNDWQKDRQRLNAFETLKSRAEAQRLLKENRQEQKMMDEFARRASQRGK
ncbi:MULTISPECIES: flagellar export protein FliJ [unclassified Escherichia]|uniref:flagellar export protein FliJ n=1 Tax=unclassified Escherichia TaxID=2608889 RepID=UPI00107F0724|nr:MULTISPECIES: flagellar export protein FliJ [unclassified Escherichia]TGB80916.1 flagellar biosynthesis protein FliJ [Escherichia sp. E4694]TGC12145.1 flagellar biosynthesis protein FliJ [Escherichia sp. E4385]TLJ03262.1 flagella biosynthesis chaperone FliJ [Escherichia sp. E4385]